MIDQLGDNAMPTDPQMTEQELRTEHPKILRQDERVEMSFRGRGGTGRDIFLFTTSRLLVRDVKGFTSSRVEYRSCPYHTIRGFAVETAGTMDRSVEVKVWAAGVGKISMNIVWDSIDIFAVKRYLNSKVLPANSVGAAPTVGPPRGPDAGKVSQFLDYLGDNARMLDPKDIETKLRSDVAFLVDDETVELAYKVGRDFTCFTNKRILQVDVQGISGKRMQYRSILWQFCLVFSVETAGGFFDIDATLKIKTKVTGMDNVDQDLKKGGANVMEIQKYLSNKLLGMDSTPNIGIPLTPDAQKAAGENSSWGKAGDMLAWLGDDMKMLDPQEADAQFHAGGSSPILQGCESVEMAFKGRRDMVLFTTKRFIEVDIQGHLMFKSTKYTSIPWRVIKAFAVESAGTFDNDSELKLWLEIDDIKPGHPGHDDDPDTPPEPRLSCISVDFRKDKVDLFAIQKYLAQRIIPFEKQLYKPSEVAVSGPVQDANADTGILDWIGNNAEQIDPQQIDGKFRSSPPILLDDENTVMAFKCGRDLTLYTTKRIIRIDTQGITGTRVEYQSIPYASIKAYSVESAGSWDRDAQVKIYIHSPWMPQISQDFRKGKADIIALQSFLSAQVIGNVDGVAGLSAEGVQAAAQAAQAAAQKAGPISGFFNWLGDNARAISTEEVNQTLHSSPPILMSDEKAEIAFQCGRDLLVVTPKRILKVDTQGFTGQRVEYLSIPLKNCFSFGIESAGSWDFDGQMSICTDIPDRDEWGNTWNWCVSQDMRKGKVDMMSLQEMLSAKLLKPGPSSTNV
jgi:hypothetical protein